MSDFDSLREDIAGIGRTFERVTDIQNRRSDFHGAEIEKLWDDNAELRDELHAVANRLENLTRAVTTDPAEVAAGIVTDANRATASEYDRPVSDLRGDVRPEHLTVTDRHLGRCEHGAPYGFCSFGCGS